MLINGSIYTVDSDMSVQEALVIADGKVLDTGTNRTMMGRYEPAKTIDLESKALFPGFHDPHCHFLGYGKSLFYTDLTGTGSFAEVIERLIRYKTEHPEVHWILGRGWDQNSWEVPDFPTKDRLDKVFPKNPVYLTRIDGHAALANRVALETIGIKDDHTFNPHLLIKKEGELTGMLIDEAMDINGPQVSESAFAPDIIALMEAQRHCLAAGLTTVTDCGLSRTSIEMVDELQREKKLIVNVHAMVNGSDESSMEHYRKLGPFRTEKLTVHAIKYYADGALGSRGARLVEPYSDDPENRGAFIGDTPYFRKNFLSAYDLGFQVCTHAIGDAANRHVLDLYAERLNGPNDRRWRIEHAQIVHPGDIHKFGMYNIIPSVQATHATSDMSWACDRLGPERLKTAYTLKRLMEQNGFLPNGSDFPIEAINPLFGFHAAVARKDHDGYPEGGFQMEQALSREEALKAMTIWAAYSSFDESNRGSLEPGKKADFVILENDIMKIPEQQITSVKVWSTYIDGNCVYAVDGESEN